MIVGSLKGHGSIRALSKHAMIEPNLHAIVLQATAFGSFAENSYLGVAEGFCSMQWGPFSTSMIFWAAIGITVPGPKMPAAPAS